MGAAGTSGADNRLVVDMGGVQRMLDERRARGEACKRMCGNLAVRVAARGRRAAGGGPWHTAMRVSAQTHSRRHIEAAAAVQCAGMITPKDRQR